VGKIAKHKPGRFKPGVSGNPAGRPKGILNVSTRFRRMLDDRADDIVRIVVEKALSGDMDALQLAFPRLIAMPRAVDQPVSLTVPADPIKAANEIVRAALAGELSADVAERLISVLRTSAELAKPTSAVTDEARGAALRELRELFTGGASDVPLPDAANPYAAQSATGNDADPRRDDDA